MRYEIKGGVFPIVVCYLEDGEQMITEKGSMVWQSPNVKMETSGGGLGKMFSKALSGESMFQNIYTAQGGSGYDHFRFQFSGKDPSYRDRSGKRDHPSEEGFSGIRERCEAGYSF